MLSLVHAIILPLLLSSAALLLSSPCAAQPINPSFGRQLWSTPATNSLYEVDAVAYDPADGSVYVINTVQLSRLLKFTSAGVDVSAAFWANSAVAVALQYQAFSVAVDPTTSAVWVANYSTVWKLSSSGALLSTIPFGNSVTVYGLAISSAGGDLYVQTIDSNSGQCVMTRISQSTSAVVSAVALAGSVGFNHRNSLAVDSVGNFHSTGVLVDSVVHLAVFSPLGAPIANLSIPAHSSGYVWIDKTDRVYVSWQTTGQGNSSAFISLYSLASNAITANYTPSSANAVALLSLGPIAGDGSGSLWTWVAVPYRLAKLSLPSLAVTQTIQPGPIPNVQAADVAGNSYSTDYANGGALMLSSRGAVVRHIPSDGSVFLERIAVDVNGTTLVGWSELAPSTFYVYSVATGALIRSFPVPYITPSLFVAGLAMDSHLNVYYLLSYLPLPEVYVVSSMGVSLPSISVPLLYLFVDYLFIDVHDQLYVGGQQVFRYSISANQTQAPTLTANVTPPASLESRPYAFDHSGYIYAEVLQDLTSNPFLPGYLAIGWQAFNPNFTLNATTYYTTLWNHVPSGSWLMPNGDYLLSDISAFTVSMYRGASSSAPALPALSPSSSAATAPPAGTAGAASTAATSGGGTNPGHGGNANGASALALSSGSAVVGIVSCAVASLLML